MRAASKASRCARARARLRRASALLAGLLSACGADLPEPPVPENLEAFDPLASARILAAVGQVRADPSRGAAWADLATIYTSERLKGPAIECLAVAERLEPRQPRWPYRAAILLAQSGDLAQAIAAIERSLALEPTYPPSHARLGRYHLDLGELDAAERCFREAIELDSSYPGGWVGVVRVALQRDRASEAVEILERLAREDPDSRTFQQLLATARRQLDPAAPVPAQAVLADPSEPVWNDPWELETHAYSRVPNLQQVERLIGSGQAQEALALLAEERARGGDPDEIALLSATAQRELGHADEARRELAPLLERQPDNVRALLLLGRLEDDAGDLAGSVEALERVNELQPGNGGVFATKAYQLTALGQHERALEAYRRARELGVKKYELRAALGSSLMALQRWPEAIELFEGMLAERPEHGDAWLQLALARLRSGDLAAADGALARGRACGNAAPRLLESVRAALERAREREGAQATDAAR